MDEVFALDVHRRKFRNEVGNRLGFVGKPDFDFGQAFAGSAVEEINDLGERSAGQRDSKNVANRVCAVVQTPGGKDLKKRLPWGFEPDAGKLFRKRILIPVGGLTRRRRRLRGGLWRAEQDRRAHQHGKCSVHDFRFASPHAF